MTIKIFRHEMRLRRFMQYSLMPQSGHYLLVKISNEKVKSDTKPDVSIVKV